VETTGEVRRPARHVALVPAGADPREIGRFRPIRDGRRRREERTSRETATAGYDIDHELFDMAVADQVRVALGALPEDLRRPILLAYFGGNTYREVAQILDEPEGTVKSRIRSGLGRLRTKLAELGVEPAGAES
jgi:RNA polymerase sigma-70 factor (ECF subfamily)